MNHILGVPMGRKLRCRNCGEPLITDGYGDLLHEDTELYQCEPREKDSKVAE